MRMRIENFMPQVADQKKTSKRDQPKKEYQNFMLRLMLHLYEAQQCR